MTTQKDDLPHFGTLKLDRGWSRSAPLIAVIKPLLLSESLSFPIDSDRNRKKNLIKICVDLFMIPLLFLYLLFYVTKIWFISRQWFCISKIVYNNVLFLILLMLFLPRFYVYLLQSKDDCWRICFLVLITMENVAIYFMNWI